MAEEIVINEGATTMVFEHAIATFETQTPRTTVDKDEKNLSAEVIALWGESNNLPDLIIEQIEKNSDLASLLHLQARIMYAGGVDYELLDPTTYKPLEKQVEPEIEAFLKRNWHYPIQACEDFYRFFNFFPQFTVTQNQQKIKWLIAQPANRCRLSKQDSNGNIKRCYINTKWGDSKPEDPDTLKYGVINAITDQPENVKERNDGPHYIYAMSYPQGKTYYAVPNWWALKVSNWLELANKIPAFKLALMKNQMTIKYHLQFPDTHWKFVYPNWDSFDAKTKVEKKEAEVKKIVDLLQGEKNAGKTIVTGYHFDIIQFKEYPGVKITAIDDKIKDGMYLEDGVMATVKLFTALGMDPAILGIVPGNGGSNRSGSDKREATMMYTQLIQPHVDMVLKPYDFAADYNGWNNDAQLVRFFFKSAGVLPTLDKVTPAERNNIKPTDNGTN